MKNRKKAEIPSIPCPHCGDGMPSAGELASPGMMQICFHCTHVVTWTGTEMRPTVPKDFDDILPAARLKALELQAYLQNLKQRMRLAEPRLPPTVERYAQASALLWKTAEWTGLDPIDRIKLLTGIWLELVSQWLKTDPEGVPHAVKAAHRQLEVQCAVPDFYDNLNQPAAGKRH